jgi:superfamily II DNA or RNA helicase/transposase-like protein
MTQTYKKETTPQQKRGNFQERISLIFPDIQAQVNVCFARMGNNYWKKSNHGEERMAVKSMLCVEDILSETYLYIIENRKHYEDLTNNQIISSVPSIIKSCISVYKNLFGTGDVSKKFLETSEDHQYRKKIELIRWASGQYCPYCKNKKYSISQKDNRYFICHGCNSNYSVLTGTSFERFKLANGGAKLLFDCVKRISDSEYSANVPLIKKHIDIENRVMCKIADRILLGKNIFYTFPLLPTSLLRKEKIHYVQPIPRPHQTDCIENISNHFKYNSRGKVIMACGTGKTLISAWSIRELKSKTCVFFTPKRILASQTSNLFKNVLSEYVTISLSHRVNAELNKRQTESFILKNGYETISGFIKRIKNKVYGKKIIIVSCYRSQNLVRSIIKSLDLKIDLCIYDEAHHVSGNVQKQNVRLVLDNGVNSERHLFFTATENNYKNNAVEKIGMSDKSFYGQTIYSLPIRQAINSEILSDYSFFSCLFKRDEIFDILKSNSHVFDTNKNISRPIKIKTLLSALSYIKAVKECGVKKTIAFCSSISEIHSLKYAITRLAEKEGIPLSCYHIHDLSGHNANAHNLQAFKRSKIPCVLCNVFMISEGFDMPEIDSALYCYPKTSGIDIIQSFGRTIRKHESKNESTVIIPTIVSESWMPINEDDLIGDNMVTLVSILRSLKNVDPELLQGFCERSNGVNINNHRLKLIPFFINNNSTGFNISDFERKMNTRIVGSEAWKFKSYEECKSWVCENISIHGVNNYVSWKKYISCADEYKKVEKLPEFIPTNPHVVFGGIDGGFSYKKFLLRPYPSYKELKNIVIANNLQTRDDYYKFVRSNKKHKYSLPIRPDKKMDGWNGCDEWESWRLFFVWDYETSKTWVKENLLPIGVNNKNTWEAYLRGEINNAPKRPIALPSTPCSVYRNSGWKGLGDFLSTGSRKNSDIHRDFLSYDMAKEIILKIIPIEKRTQVGFRKHCVADINFPYNIPKNPSAAYKNKGWISWGDFLGTNRVAWGRKTINTVENGYGK